MGGRACEQVGEGRGAPDPANKHNVCVCSERGERGPYRMFHEMGWFVRLQRFEWNFSLLVLFFFTDGEN